MKKKTFQVRIDYKSSHSPVAWWVLRPQGDKVFTVVEDELDSNFWEVIEAKENRKHYINKSCAIIVNPLENEFVAFAEYLSTNFLPICKESGNVWRSFDSAKQSLVPYNECTSKELFHFWKNHVQNG